MILTQFHSSYLLAIAKAVCMHQRSNLREPSYNHFLASQLATFLRLSGNQARRFSEFHLSLTNQVTPPTCSRLPRKCTAIIHCQINLHRRPFVLFDQMWPNIVWVWYVKYEESPPRYQQTFDNLALHLGWNCLGWLFVSNRAGNITCHDLPRDENIILAMRDIFSHTNLNPLLYSR